MSDFLVWEFCATKESFDQWSHSVLQLSCCNAMVHKEMSATQKSLFVSIENHGYLVIGETSPGHWVLECRTQLAEAFHWLFRYFGAVCLPRNGGYRECCNIGMQATTVASGELDIVKSCSAVDICNANLGEIVLFTVKSRFRILFRRNNNYLYFSELQSPELQESIYDISGPVF